MQTRPYPEKDGRRIWLSRDEQRRLLDAYRGEEPRRFIAMQLGLHGLRTDEILRVEPRHIRQLDGTDEDRYVLTIPEGKTGKRETPVSSDLAQRISYLKGAARMRQDEAVIDVSKRTVRNWIRDARESAYDGDLEDWHELGMHDLRRTWATDSYYSLAFEGVPIAEQLTMSWGGWAMTDSGRETFRRNYLGPVPDHITERAMQNLTLV